jgi:hypothetical protein
MTVSDKPAGLAVEALDDIRDFMDVAEALHAIDLLEANGMPVESAQKWRRSLQLRAAHLAARGIHSE